MSLVRLTLVLLAVAAMSANAFAQGTPQQRAACRADVAKFCKGKGDDPGVILTCLEDNRDKLAERCQKVIAENDPKPAEKKDQPPAETKAGEKK